MFAIPIHEEKFPCRLTIHRNRFPAIHRISSNNLAAHIAQAMGVRDDSADIENSSAVGA
jgi:hypothetical protein